MTSINPAVSFQQKDAVVNTSFYKTLLVVGQSNTATAGLYKDVELKSQADINTLFGASSHLAACLRDVQTIFSNSIIKPKVMAVSYADLSSGTARVLSCVITGTATENRTIYVKLNSMNPDRIMTQQAAVLSLRNTKGAYAGNYARNAVEFGSPVNASMGFNPILADATTNDTLIQVDITSGMAAADIAAAINAAINASTTAIYSSSVSSATLTITAKHKGVIGNFFPIEFVSNTDSASTSFAAGTTYTISQTIAGAGVVDNSAFLSIVDSKTGLTLAETDFDYLVLPYGYSVTALVTDSKAKWDNCLQYNNRCLEYWIMRATALDLSSDTALNSLASAEPIEAKGIIKNISILKTDGFVIRAVSDYTTRNKIEAKQFTPIQREFDGSISVGNFYSLSNSSGFVNMERVLAAALFRQIIVEKFIPADFIEKNYTFGKAVNAFTYSKSDVIAKFQYYRDIFDGTVVNSDYGTDFSGLVANDSDARATFDEVLDLSISFDKVTKQLILQLANELNNPIKSIFAISYYS